MGVVLLIKLLHDYSHTDTPLYSTLARMADEAQGLVGSLSTTQLIPLKPLKADGKSDMSLQQVSCNNTIIIINNLSKQLLMVYLLCITIYFHSGC